jgi:hypothetical protein
VIEQHIGRAERRGDGRNRGVDLGLARDVGGGKHCRAARCLDLGYDGTPRLLVAVDNADLGALGREKPRRGASHAGCTARDQCNLACQSAGHHAFILLLRDGQLF